MLLPQEAYAAWQETRYLLASPANAAHLRTSIAEVTEGVIAERKLFDV
ncbi:hypothetical protein [Candidatus Chloroploca sp. Khr17]